MPQTALSLVIAIKSINLACLSAYHFTQAALKNPKVWLNLVFFYQDGVYVLLNSTLKSKWINLINSNNINASLCKGSCHKREVKIVHPFNAGTLIEFINCCEKANRVVQF